MHDIGRVTHGGRHEHYWSQLTEGGGFRALAGLREQGAIKAFGLGVNEVEIIEEAIKVADLDICMLAGRYTLLEQMSLPLMDACAARGIGIVIAGAFNSGILAGSNKFNYGDPPADIVARVEALRSACGAEGVTLQAAALQFPLAHPAALTCRLRRAQRRADQGQHRLVRGADPGRLLDAAEGARPHRRQRSCPRLKGAQSCGSMHTSISGGSPTGPASGRRPISRRFIATWGRRIWGPLLSSTGFDGTVLVQTMESEGGHRLDSSTSRARHPSSRRW